VADPQAAAADTPDDPRVRELVGELAVRSPAFRSLWADPVPRSATTDGSDQLHHPAVGGLVLRYEAFVVRSAPRQQLVVLQADPDTRSAEALVLLSATAPAGDG